MQRSSFALVALAAAFAAGGATAQTSGQQSNQPNPSNQSGAATAPRTATAPRSDEANERWQRTHRVSKIIGTDVRNRQNEKVGDVKDVVLDDRGNVAYAVVSVGGFLGIGDRMFAIPWNQFQRVPNQDHIVLDVNKERLQNARGFTDDGELWRSLSNPQWANQTRDYWSRRQGA